MIQIRVNYWDVIVFQKALDEEYFVDLCLVMFDRDHSL